MSFSLIFPAALHADGEALFRPLIEGASMPSWDGFIVQVQGETLAFPARVYWAPEQLRATIAASTGDARRLALCLGTRHHDGFLREACVRQLGEIDRAWVLPFMVQLLGEAVVEVSAAVEPLIRGADPEEVAAFVAANPDFVAKTKQRVISYWDCYYRYRFKRLQAYPSYRALLALLRALDPSHDRLTEEAHRRIAEAAPRRGRVVDSLLDSPPTFVHPPHA